MILDAGNTDKLAIFKGDLERMNIPLLPPDVNASQATFDVEIDPESGKKAVRYALNAIKNVGGAAMDNLVASRTSGGPFKNLEDFATRVDTRAAGSGFWRISSRPGAFDSIDPNRGQLFINVERLNRFGIAVTEERNSSQSSLFGGPSEGQRWRGDAADADGGRLAPAGKA